MKRIITYTSKLLLTCLILYFLISHLEFSNFKIAIDKISVSTLLFVFSITIINIIIQFFRFKSMSVLLTKKPKPIELISSFLSGFTFKFLVPGGYGDLGKMIFIDDEVKPRINIFLMEKISTLLLTLFLGTICIATFFKIYLLFPLALIPLAVYIYFQKLKGFSFLRKFFIQDIDLQKRIFIHISYTIFMYITVAIQYYLLSNDFLQTTDTFLQTITKISVFFLITVILLATNLLPLTIGGLGLRESVGFYLFPLVGMTEESGVVIPLVTFLLNSGIPAIFGVFILFTRPKFYLRKK